MLQNFSHATSHQEAYKNSVSNSITRQCVRVVKEPDLKSGGLCPRRFESCRWRASIVQWLEYLPSKQVARVRFPVDASAISLVAMIPRCQRGGPSSILGWRTFWNTQWHSIVIIIFSTMNTGHLFIFKTTKIHPHSFRITKQSYNIKSHMCIGVTSRVAT